MPDVVTDLYRDPAAARKLAVATLALLAAGLDPRVFYPGLMAVQGALRTRPEIEQMLLLGGVLSAFALLVGGVLGDTDGRRRIQIGALGTLVVTGVLGLLFQDGPVFLAAQFIGAAAASIILPIALAMVAVTYQGIARATAIGVAYAAYAAAGAAAPILLTLFGPTGPRWPAFIAATIAAVIALEAARRSWVDLPSPSRRQRRRVRATAIWATGVIATFTGFLGLAQEFTDRLRTGDGLLQWLQIGLLVGGLALLAVAAIVERGLSSDDAVRIARRPVATALLAGFILAFAQVVPLAQLPLFFQLINGYGPLGAGVALAPFIVALVVTGPVVGVLLGRIAPRPLIVGGITAVGLGNIVLGVVVGPTAPYVVHILPMLLIGAGFVVATTVRTAIIFASVPRGLPATAAALNEGSLALGVRAGLVLSTTMIAALALDQYAETLAGATNAVIDAALAGFSEVLAAIGLPAYALLISELDPADAFAYGNSYILAVRTVFVSVGVLTLVAAAGTWFLVGRRDPLSTVWDYRDERSTSTGPGPTTPADPA
jgi:MFS family permease